MARNNHSLRINDDLWDAFQLERKPGKCLAKYRSDNAAIENLMAYMLYFRREHDLIFSSLDDHQQDLVFAYIKFCVENDINDRERLPKPAKAEDVLKLAKEWARPDSRP